MNYETAIPNGGHTFNNLSNNNSKLTIAWTRSTEATPLYHRACWPGMVAIRMSISRPSRTPSWRIAVKQSVYLIDQTVRNPFKMNYNLSIFYSLISTLLILRIVHYYSFKIFHCFWLLKTTHIIHHNKLQFTNLKRIFNILNQCATHWKLLNRWCQIDIKSAARCRLKYHWLRKPGDKAVLYLMVGKTEQ